MDNSATQDRALWELPAKFDSFFEVVDVAGKRVLDVGSGDGSLVRLLIDRGAQAIGVECGPTMLERAHAADPDHPDRYLDGVGQDLPIDDASVDVVVFSSSLHHVPTDAMADALHEAGRVLADGGMLCVLEPVAEGAGFQVNRIIDDETVVRAAAQDRMDNDVPARLVEQPVVRFDASYSYADIDELEHTIVGINPSRAAQFESLRSEIAERIETLGVRHADAWWFPQPMILRRFVAQPDYYRTIAARLPPSSSRQPSPAHRG